MKDTYTEYINAGPTSHLDFDNLTAEEQANVKAQLLNAVHAFSQIFHPRCGVVLLVRDPENELGHLKFIMGIDNMEAMAEALVKTVAAHLSEFKQYEEVKRKIKSDREGKFN